MKKDSPFRVERTKNEIYVFYNEELIYKKWIDENGEKTQSSKIFDKWGLPWCIDHAKRIEKKIKEILDK